LHAKGARNVKRARFPALTLLALSLVMLTAGCIPFSGLPTQYAESYELYDARDSKTVRAVPARGNKFVIVGLELEFLGYADSPYDIREDFTFMLIKPGAGIYFTNFYENESWDFMDEIAPVFRFIGESHTGSIFFEVPNDDVADYLIRAICDVGFYDAKIFDIKLSKFPRIENYPEGWD